MSYTFHQENQAWSDNGEAAEPVEVDGKEVADPTAMSGTIDTSGTSGETETAADVSPVFDVANQAAAENPIPEGIAGTTSPDPAATGEDSLKVDYSKEAAAEEERRNASLGGQTTDTTGESVAPVASEADAVAAGADEPDPSVGDENKFDGRKNPDEYSVKEVLAYFAGATDAQIKKVQAKEKDGQARKTIMEYSKA